MVSPTREAGASAAKSGARLLLSGTGGSLRAPVVWEGGACVGALAWHVGPDGGPALEESSTRGGGFAFGWGAAAVGLAGTAVSPALLGETAVALPGIPGGAEAGVVPRDEVVVWSAGGLGGGCFCGTVPVLAPGPGAVDGEVEVGALLEPAAEVGSVAVP